jgi:hypothetical protein
MPLTLTANRDSQFVSIGISHLRISAGSLLAPSGATLRVLHSRELSRSTRLDCGLRETQAFAQDDRGLGPFQLHGYGR